MAMLLPYEQPAVIGLVGRPHLQDGLGVFPAKELPSLDAYYVELGDGYRQQSKHDLAQDAYLTALTYNVTSAAGYFGLGEARFWLGRWQEAIHAFETSIRYRYTWPALAYRGMGWSYYNLQQHDLAKRAFQQAIYLDPGLADGYNGLGWVLLQEGRCDVAVSYFEQAIALDPSFPEPQRGISECVRR